MAKLWEGRFGDPLIDAETFRINSNGYLLEIGNKPKEISQVQGQYMGLLRFTPKGWGEFKKVRNLEDSKKNSLDMTKTLQMFLENSKMSIKTIPFNGKWGEIDSEKDLKYY